MKQFTRKVQKIGPSSLAVSFPIEWARELNIEATNYVTINWMDDGTLNISPKESVKKSEPCPCVVPVVRLTETEFLRRIIVALYLYGHDQLIITSQTDMDDDFLSALSAGIRKLNGIDIVHKTPKKVVLQCFIEPTRYLFTGLQRRLYHVSNECLEKAIAALEWGDEFVDRVSILEDEVDRLYWLTLRQLLLCADRRDLAFKAGLSPRSVAEARLAIKIFEKLSDYSESIAKDVPNLIKGSSPEIPRKLSELAQSVRSTFDKAAKAYFTLDSSLANNAIEEASVLKADLRRFSSSMALSWIDIGENVSKRNLGSLRAVLQILNNLIQISNSCSTLGEVTINLSAEKCDWCHAEESQVFSLQETIQEYA